MKNKFIYGKSLIALAMAATMVVGEASVVMADPSSSSAAKTDIVGSYDGNVSKVIGVEGDYTENYSVNWFRDANKNKVAAYYNADIKDTTVSVYGNLEYTVDPATGKKTKSVDSATGLYAYNGVYYAYATYDKWRNVTTFSNPVTVIGTYDVSTDYTALNTAEAQYLDVATGLYKVGESYYTSLRAGKVTVPTVDSEGETYDKTTKVTLGVVENSNVIPIGKYSSYTDMSNAKKALKKKADGTAVGEDGKYDYYDVNGRMFINNGWNAISYIRNYYYDSTSGKSTYEYVLYANPRTEIFLGEKVNPVISWNDLSTYENLTTPEGKGILVGYQIEADGVFVTPDDVVTGAPYYLSDGTTTPTYVFDSSSVTLAKKMAAGESVKVRVRGVYFTMTETKVPEAVYPNNVKEDGYTQFTYALYKTGDWSDEYTYTYGADAIVPNVADLSAAVDGTKVKLTWTPVEKATSATVYAIHTNDAIVIDANTVDTFCTDSYGDEKNDGTYVYETTSVSVDPRDSSMKLSLADDVYDNYQLHYYVMKLNRASKGNQVAEKAYSNIAGLSYKTGVNVPTVANLRVEYNLNGGFNIVWDKADSNAKVVVYAYEKAAMPEWFNVYELGAKSVTVDADGNKEIYYLYDDLTYDTWASIAKVKSVTTSYSAGSVSSDAFNLEIGKKYYFVAYTYDDINIDTPKVPITYNGVSYAYYNDFSAPSAIVSAKETLAAPDVATSVTKNSIKLTMRNTGTGNIIYRKNSKGKFVKIATVTNDEYTDENLTLGTKYTYKVVSYYYNKDKKQVTTSKKSTVVSAVPSTVQKFEVNAVQAASNKVKLTWNKVSKATKYEVYRAKNVDRGDYKIWTSGTDFGSGVELVKTIKKGSTTKYTDKVTSGASYLYYVVAYYKEGKAVGTIYNGDYIEMGLAAPSDLVAKVSGSSVKLSWTANKFAKGYQVTYRVYDKDGNSVYNCAQVATTTKTTYTIKNVPAGGSVEAYVRSYDGSKTFSYSTYTVSASRGLGVTKKITAKYDATKKAVKVSWKAVSGAAYYRVFRSTMSADYDKDCKKYIAAGWDIAKESNDDERYDEVKYDEYLGQPGTIVGTSAYDYADLEDAATYYYTVVAYSANGKICSQTACGEVASGAPASVVYNAPAIKISSVKAKKTTVTIKYNKVKSPVGTTKYVIYRSTKKNGTYEKVGTTTKTAYVDKTVKKGKTYYYKVVATGTNGLRADYTVTSAAKGVKIKK